MPQALTVLLSRRYLCYSVAYAVIINARCYAERDIATVRPSVRLSVTLSYRGHMVGIRLRRPQHHGPTPKRSLRNFGRNRGEVWKQWLSAYKSSNISETAKRGKIWPRLLLTTNRQSNTRFRTWARLQNCSSPRQGTTCYCISVQSRTVALLNED